MAIQTIVYDDSTPYAAASVNNLANSDSIIACCEGDAMQERDAAIQLLNEANHIIVRAASFVGFVEKCVRKNGEYSPLHWQEMDELHRDLSQLIKDSPEAKP